MAKLKKIGIKHIPNTSDTDKNHRNLSQNGIYDWASFKL